MVVSFQTQDRATFILFGRVVAEVLKEGVVSLEGNSDSGKSLLALAADLEMHPARYEPDGITPTTKVHKQIGIDAKERLSVFFSDGLSEFFSSHVNSSRWLNFLNLRKNHGIRLAYLSNVWNWTSDSIDPKDPAVFADNKIPVQARINVQTVDDGEFIRNIKLTCVRSELEEIIRARFEERLRAEQPAPRNSETRRCTGTVKPEGHNNP